MDKSKMNIRYLLLLLFMLFNIHSFSQEFTKELQWKIHDSIMEPVFQNTEQIVEWGKNFGSFVSVRSENLQIKECNIFVLMVNVCSGFSCPFIYIFKEEDKLWKCLAITYARLSKGIEKVEVDTIQEKIIFKTKSHQIGELPFEILNLSPDKAE